MLKTLLVLLLLCTRAWASPPEPLRMDQLDWLQGQWVGDFEGAFLEESWSEPRGTTMLGHSRMVAGGKTVHREFLLIESMGNETWLFLSLPHPQGKTTELKMKLREQTLSSLTFFDPERPDDVLDYRSEGQGRLQIRLQKKDTTIFHLHRLEVDAAHVRARLNGTYVLSTYIGPKIFQDQLEWSTPSSGKLTVPGAFSAALERVKIVGQKVSFEVEVNEGGRQFRVGYTLYFDRQEQSFVGFLRELKPGGKLIGSFVGRRSP